MDSIHSALLSTCLRSAERSRLDLLSPSASLSTSVCALCALAASRSRPATLVSAAALIALRPIARLAWHGLVIQIGDLLFLRDRRFFKLGQLAVADFARIP